MSSREASPAPVTLIATVLNEERSLPALLASIEGQTRQPDEVIFVDGGSRDGTVALLQRWAQTQPYPVRVLVAPGSNIAAGRNRAVAAATKEIICCTDAGVVLEPEWLAALTSPFGNAARPAMVAGVFRGVGDNAFQVAMAATVLPLPNEIHETTFLPSSRSVAFSREAWQHVGGYPEWAGYCEDVLFDLAIRNAGLRVVLARDAVVRFAPRRSLRSFWRQYRNYSRGDAVAGLWPQRHLIRYATYLLLVPALAWAALSGNRVAWLLSALGAAAYLRRPYARLAVLARPLPWRERLRAAAWVPVIRVWGDLAKMAGYPRGLLRGYRSRRLTARYLAAGLRRAGDAHPDDDRSAQEV